MSDEKINGAETSATPPRPSLAEMLGSVLGKMEKPTDENLEERNAAAKAREDAIIVHSPHVLMEHECDAIRQQGRNPDDFCGMALLGSLSAQRDLRTGKYLFILAVEIPPGMFPALDSPVLQADGTATTAKFDRQIPMPLCARLIIEKNGVGEKIVGNDQLRKNIDLLIEHDGRTYGDLMAAGYVNPKHG